MEKLDLDNISEIQGVKLEPINMDDCKQTEYRRDIQTEVKLEDSIDNSGEVHLPSDIDDMYNSEVQIKLDDPEYVHMKLEPVDLKLELEDCSEFYYEEDHVKNEQDIEHLLDDRDSIYSCEFSSIDAKLQEVNTSRSDVSKLQDVEIVQFLALYASEKMLYDRSDKEYNNRNSRILAAERISHSLKIPGFGPTEVITGFKNLRKLYFKELKKIIDSGKSGEVYRPKISWFNQMDSFIRPFVQRRIPSSKVLPQDPTKESRVKPIRPKQSKSPYYHQSVSEEIVPRTEHNTMKPETFRTTVKRRMHSTGLQSSPIKIRKVECHSKMDFNPGAIRKSHVSNRVDHIQKDFYDHFGAYVASLLRSIEPVKAMRLQRMITSQIIKAMCSPPPVSNT